MIYNHNQVAYHHELDEHGECLWLHVHGGGVCEVVVQVSERPAGQLQVPDGGRQAVPRVPVLAGGRSYRIYFELAIIHVYAISL